MNAPEAKPGEKPVTVTNGALAVSEPFRTLGGLLDALIGSLAQVLEAELPRGDTRVTAAPDWRAATILGWTVEPPIAAGQVDGVEAEQVLARLIAAGTALDAQRGCRRQHRRWWAKLRC
jgi:hypothetical protein